MPWKPTFDEIPHDLVQPCLLNTDDDLGLHMEGFIADFEQLGLTFPRVDLNQHLQSFSLLINASFGQ